MPTIEPDRAEEVIPDKHLAFDKGSKKLHQWFDKFGYERDEEDIKFPLCHMIDGNSKVVEEVNGKIATVLDEILDRKRSQEKKVRD
jgi:hypothetical protein